MINYNIANVVMDKVTAISYYKFYEEIYTPIQRTLYDIDLDILSFNYPNQIVTKEWINENK